MNGNTLSNLWLIGASPMAQDYACVLKARHVIQSSTLLYVMPEERSVDIDSELDFRWVEFLMNDEQKSAH